MTGTALRGALAAAFARAVASIDVEARVAAAMPRVPRGVRAGAVVAVGKAAPAMARGALSVAGEWCARALVVAPDGTEAGLADGRAELLRAAHPDPDARSVVAARRALEVARGADFVVVLVSGGASSLVCLPEGMPLARYVRVVRALRMGGATVKEVNVVRRHLCAVKGGGLARVVSGPVRTLVASDVIGGAAYDVGSGPSVADPTTRAQARAVLKRYAPRLALPPLHESLKPGSSSAARGLRARLVARPEELARAVARELRGVFERVRVLPASLAPAAVLAREYVARVGGLRPGEAVVRSAEPSVVVDGTGVGRGGRSTHLATLLAAELPRGVAFLAAASDGVDGESDSGGAVVDGSLRAVVGLAVLERALAAFDTGSLLASAGFTLALRPSGTNLADVHVLARGDR
jgi:hydroxypyruvate reductase